MKLILPVITDDQEFKFLQLKLVIDTIDSLISDCRKLRQSITMQNKIAGLCVFKKNFETQLEVGAE